MGESRLAQWGRLVFTGGAYDALQSAPETGASRPGAFASGFRPEWEDYLRAQYGRALAQAREFVDFVDPRPGWAVVEVGAGAGRITFDGRLAARVGLLGQVLLTDPSGAQLNAAITRAHEMDLGWVRALRAPAEALPLGSGCADLVLGSAFLQFAEQDRAVSEMARVVRPGGIVAISQGLDFTWPSGWWDALQPVREVLGRAGLEPRRVFPPEGDLLGSFARAGLPIERRRITGPEAMDFPSVDIAIGFWRLNSLVSVLLADLPPERHPEVQEAFEERTRAMFARTSDADRRLSIRVLDLVARKPE